MAVKVYEDGNIAAIAEKIREKTGGDKTYKTSEMPEGVGEVYDAGIEQGKQAEYDLLWNAIQWEGKRNNYQMAFAQQNWGKHNFYPKYDMRPVTLNTGFHNFGRDVKNLEEDGVDFVEVFDNRGIVFDTSECTNFMSCFMWAKIKRLGVIDARKDTSNLSNTFSYGQIETIEKLIINDSCTFANTFMDQRALENLIIEGTITKSGLDLHCATKLTKASITSVRNALEEAEYDEVNFIPGRDATSITLSLKAVNKAFETSEGANDGSISDEWHDLTLPKSMMHNWTIALV